MSDERQDPADTQMFRAYVERGEPAPPRRWVPILIVLALVLGAVVGAVLALR